MRRALLLTLTLSLVLAASCGGDPSDRGGASREAAYFNQGQDEECGVLSGTCADPYVCRPSSEDPGRTTCQPLGQEGDLCLSSWDCDHMGCCQSPDETVSRCSYYKIYCLDAPERKPPIYTVPAQEAEDGEEP